MTDFFQIRSAAIVKTKIPGVLFVAPLLFCSGACALVYQTVWLREFRLIFGASTAASAAVLAIFMAGLGVGSALLGARVDRARRPLAVYGVLELGIAIAAAVTPALAGFARETYLAAGGSAALGTPLATGLRLVLSAVVLLVPTFLMGGTLPAAAQAVVNRDDSSRGNLATLYGANAVGAMTGALVSTFFLLEHFGNQGSLWIACCVNGLVAAAALRGSRRVALGVEPLPADPEPVPAGAGEQPAPAGLVYAAAGIAGFVFLLMELVWYRMLGPLLGGSVYTFGVILAVALLGIGIGGVCYRLWYRNRRVTIEALALTCALEALLIAIPFWMGDRLALLALALRAFGAQGFGHQVAGWTAMTFLVVFPAAWISGLQFPLLIGLLGRGRANLGRQVGRAYAWNTLGAIAGSLAGGFGLLPVLSAPGAWRASVVILGAFSLLLGLLAPVRRTGRAVALASGALACTAFVLQAAPGPGPAWRHGGIGAGRADFLLTASPVVLADQMRNWRRFRLWEADGVESSVALYELQSYGFIVNGRIDGSVRGDAPTFVMSAMTGALLHPSATSAFVVGLGTGSSAGWLGMIPRMQRVDVLELEPRVADIAAACALANGDPLHNPKVHLDFGDARERLLTSHQRYDLILSNPSNPYRAGVASLFTREFYEAAAQRLETDGIFLQWVQAYEVTPETVRDVHATLGSVFGEVQTWQTMVGDLVFVATQRPLVLDAGQLRASMAQEPFRSALYGNWHVDTLEGLLAHFVGGPKLSRALAGAAGSRINTDDSNHVEFAFARSIGRKFGFDPRFSSESSSLPGAGRPEPPMDGVDWSSVERERDSFYGLSGETPPDAAGISGERAYRIRLFADFRVGAGDLRAAARHWREHPFEPANPAEVAMIAELLADTADQQALPLIDRLRARQPIEADAVAARLAYRRGDTRSAAAYLQRSLVAYRADPWPWPAMMLRALLLAQEVAAGGAADPAAGAALIDAVQRPYAVHMWEHYRKLALVSIAASMHDDPLLAGAVRAFEPDVPWDRGFLETRAVVYQRVRDPLAGAAVRDLERVITGAGG